MRHAFVFIFMLVAFATQGQNKTLGVGVSSPNPNAALHVESPTSNQGFIMPRLTTTQRTAMTSILTATDIGLMLYDTDLKTHFTWSGTAWQSTKLSYPYKDSVVTSPPAGVNDVFALKYNGSGNARVMRIESLNLNQSSALSVQQQGRGLAAFFEQANDTTSTSTLYSRIKTNHLPNAGQLAPVAIYGESTGVGALGGAFWNLHASNNFPALYSRTLGTGSAAQFDIVNATNGAPALLVTTNGTGNAIQTQGKIQAGQFIGDGSLLTNLPPISLPFATSLNSNTTGFSIDNSGNGPAITGSLSGSSIGTAISGYNTSNQNSFAGQFTNSNSANTYPAIQAGTQGLAPGVRVIQDATSVGSGMDIYLINPASSATGFAVNNSGGGNLASFNSTGTGWGVTINLADNASFKRALEVTHNGSSGEAGNFIISNPSNSNAALNASTMGNGAAISGNNGASGTAASFTTSDPANTSPAIQVSTQGASPGLRVFQNATSSGGGLDVFIQNANATMPGLSITHQGKGAAVSLSVTNALNSSPVLSISNSGTGEAIIAAGKITATTFQGDGSLLTNLPSSAWGFTGNSGTVDGTSFIGTTDGVPLSFRVNNVKSGRIDQTLANTFFGYQSGNAITTGGYNVGVGLQALFSNVTGTDNTAIGTYALHSSTGSQNTAIGTGSMYNNTTGIQNIATGGQALSNNTTGSQNAGYGFHALGSSTVGSSNSAFGYFALASNVAGTGGTAFGAGAMQYANDAATPFTNFNVAVGFEALKGSITPSANVGNENTAIGYQTLSANTSGELNTALGGFALTSNTTGINNTAIGAESTGANTIGNNITAVGAYTLQVSTGSGNTAIGANSLANNSTGVSNSALGNGSLQYNTSGNNNVAIGDGSLSVNSTGTNNTAIGSTSNVSSGNLTNATAIGFGAFATASNTIQLGNNSVTSIYAGTGTNATLYTGSLGVNGQTYTWPASQSSGVLTNNGSGGLTWSAGFALPYSQSDGSGSTSFAITNSAGTGSAAEFDVQNASNTSAAINIIHSGTGNALTANRAVSVNVTTLGNAGVFQINNPSNISAGLTSLSNGTGVAGSFVTTNASSTNPTVFAQSGSSAAAIRANNTTGTGYAFEFANGGLISSVYSLAGGGSIPTRAVAYLIINGTGYTFSFTLNEGDTFFVYNSSASPATIGGVNVPANSGMTMIVMASVLRGF